MEVGVGEVNLHGGRAGVQGAIDGRAGDKNGGCLGCEVKYGWVHWVGNGHMGMGRIG